MDLTIVQLLPALEVGGVERGAVDVAREIVRRGHRAVVVSAGGRLLGELEQAGAEHYCWPIGRKSPLSFAYWHALRRLLRELRADIVHARSRLPAWLGLAACRSLPAPCRPHFVTTVHGPYSVNAYSAVMVKGERVIAISEYIRDYVLRNYPQVSAGALALIHRGVDPQAFPYGYRPSQRWLTQWHAQHPQLRGRFLLTLPARITRWKGQAEFLDVAADLLRAGLPVHALIAGGAAPRRRRFLAELHRRVRELGLGDRVSFLGDRSDLRDILAVSDLVVSLANVPEAFGRTTLEALSLGRPAVGFAHGGTREILSAIYPQGLCPPGDLQAVAARIAALMRAPVPVPRQHAFTLEAMLEKTMQLYARVAGSPPSS